MKPDIEQIAKGLNAELNPDVLKTIKDLTIAIQETNERGGYRYKNEEYIHRDITGNLEEALEAAKYSDLDGFMSEVIDQIDSLKDQIEGLHALVSDFYGEL